VCFFDVRRCFIIRELIVCPKCKSGDVQPKPNLENLKLYRCFDCGSEWDKNKVDNKKNEVRLLQKI